MKEQSFEELLLRTAFSCMVCDGDIHPKEIDRIRIMEEEGNLFGLDDLESSLNNLIEMANKDAIQFLRDFLMSIEKFGLSPDQEKRIVNTAIKVIDADEIREYSEIKFFKVIRSKLKSSNEELLSGLEDVTNPEEFFEQDIISESYLRELSADYFDNQEISEFEKVDLKGIQNDTGKK